MVEILIDQIFEDIVETIREPLLVLDSDLMVISANRSFIDSFKVTREETLGNFIYDLGNKQWDIPKLRELLETILPEKTSFDNYEVEHDFATIGRRIMILNARQIEQAMGKERIILLAIKDITERKRQKELLEDSEERFRRLFETASDGILLLEKREGNIVQANPAIREMLGLSEDELIGKDLKHIGFPEHIEVIHKILQTLEKDGIIHYKDTSIEKKNRRIVDTDIYMVDKTNLVQCNIRDITERKKAEKSLKESEENYRILFDDAPDLIVSLNSDGNFLDLNKKFEEETVYSREEMIGKSIFTSGILTESSVNTSIPYFEEILGGKKWVMFEVEGVTKDGSKIPYELRAVPIKKDGKIVAVQAILRNITERKQVEQSLAESENRFKALHNASFGGIAIHDQGIILECNQGLSEITGYEYSELIGMNGLHLIAERFREALMNNILSDYEKPYEAMGLRKNGEEFPIRLEARNIPFKGKQVRTVEFRDITEQKKSEIESEKLQAQLTQAQKMESIGTLAGGVAHDFNNILTTIIGNAEFMLMDIDTDRPLTENIMEIKIAGERAAALTRQLLAFSRKQIVQPEILDLNKLLTGIEKMLVRLIGEDIEILMIPESALWKIEIDPGQMEQVIMNLAVNAKDAMPLGGKLTIETVNMDLNENYFDEHGIFEKQSGSYVLLTVSDTGIGMDKGAQEHIFDPFYTTKKKGKGTGLGLSTSYGIVKQNNGFIWVYSEPGQGSTFKIYLPRVKRDIQTEEKEQPPVENLSGSETVLIVEDDIGLRKLMQKSLQPHGYRVLVAENGEDALRISKEHKGTIDLIITDVVMPKMGGKEAAERLQALHPQVKVIYMSGYTDEAIVHHGVLAPGLNFLEKPFSPGGLVHKVRELLDKK